MPGTGANALLAMPLTTFAEAIANGFITDSQTKYNLQKCASLVRSLLNMCLGGTNILQDNQKLHHLQFPTAMLTVAK